MKIISKYKNGNYDVTLYEDGTKIRENNLDFFDADYPESMDLKITNRCPMGCPACHEMSVPNGEHGDIMNAHFIDTLHRGTEIAIGGGAVTGHPDLVPFLKKLKDKGIFPSITVHQKEYENNKELINMLINEKLIYGLGVSFSSFDDTLWDEVLKYPNTVVHLIAGMHAGDVFEYFSRKNAKVLILGFKDFGRGHLLLENGLNNIIPVQINWLKENLRLYMFKFKVISFDNLAIEQLDIKNKLSNEQWDAFYQGDDGTHTMYVDLVKKQFAKTSTSTERYDLLDNIDDMFKIIKGREIPMSKEEMDTVYGIIQHFEIIGDLTDDGRKMIKECFLQLWEENNQLKEKLKKYEQY